MQIPGKKITAELEKELKKEVKHLKKKKKSLDLVVFLVGKNPDQIKSVKAKQKLAKSLKIKFELIHIKDIPNFAELIHKIKEKSTEEKTNGIIIQQPLPPQLQTESIYDFFPVEKEIEGHKKKTLFYPPLGLAVLTVLKYIFSTQKISGDLFIDFKKDRSFFKKIFKNKKVVLVGRGINAGLPIGRTLNGFKINFINTHSQTPNASDYYKEADVLISAVGKKVITADMVKPNVVLISVGLRKENGRLKGDYDEKEIKDIASFYTSTPGGVEMLNILYLYKNLIDAAKLQK